MKISKELQITIYNHIKIRIGSDKMILTYNYQDLQNIKEQMKKDNIKDEKDIYFSISSCKDTLNFMYKNKLAKDLTKEDLQEELQDFASSLLKNTNKSYDELENLYKSKITKNYIINSSEIKVKK